MSVSSNICLILPVIFPLVLIADGPIDREPQEGRVSDKSALSVPAELTAGPTDDLTDQLDELVLPHWSARGETEGEAGPRHDGDVEPAGLPRPGLVVAVTGDVVLLTSGVRHGEGQPGGVLLLHLPPPQPPPVALCDGPALGGEGAGEGDPVSRVEDGPGADSETGGPGRVEDRHGDRVGHLAGQSARQRSRTGEITVEMSVDVLQQQLGGVHMAEVGGGTVGQCVEEDVVQVPVDRLEVLVSHLALSLQAAGETDVGGRERGRSLHHHHLLSLPSHHLQPHPGQPDHPDGGELTGPALPPGVGEDTGVLALLPGRHSSQLSHHGTTQVLGFHRYITLVPVDLAMSEVTPEVRGHTPEV